MPSSLPVFDPHVAPTSYLTAGVPAVGGTLKARPEDFLVEEIAAYEPCGTGEHLYLCIEKKNLATSQLVRILARHYRVDRRAIGFAGLKDKHAITRQVISIHLPGKHASEFKRFEHNSAQILWAERHTNMLRRGHLRGNRFVIRLRDVEPADVIHVDKALKILAQRGVPNRFGEQRFGVSRNNHIIGRAIIIGDHQTVMDELLGPGDHHPPNQTEARTLFAQGDYATAREAFNRHAHVEQAVLRSLVAGKKPRRAAYSFDITSKRFFISAFQSAIFNMILDQRLASQAFDQLIPGDLALKHDNHAVFAADQTVVEDPDTARRLTEIEISPTGPMWGEGMMRPEAPIFAAELHALISSGISLEELENHGNRSGDPVKGARRPLRVGITEIQVEGGVDDHGNYIKCTFTLPKGAFATEVMREVMKPKDGTPDPLVIGAEDDGD